jgi:hypothetical protein
MRVLTVAVLLSTTLTATQALECHLERINACSSVCGCCRLCLLLLVPAELCQGHLHPQLLALTIILQAGAVAVYRRDEHQHKPVSDGCAAAAAAWLQSLYNQLAVGQCYKAATSMPQLLQGPFIKSFCETVEQQLPHNSCTFVAAATFADDRAGTKLRHTTTYLVLQKGCVHSLVPLQPHALVSPGSCQFAKLAISHGCLARQLRCCFCCGTVCCCHGLAAAFVCKALEVHGLHERVGAADLLAHDILKEPVGQVKW